LSEKSATFRDHALLLRMILSEKSATFRDHALMRATCEGSFGIPIATRATLRAIDYEPARKHFQQRSVVPFCQPGDRSQDAPSLFLDTGQAGRRVNRTR
jgi:hypothetical protein